MVTSAEYAFKQATVSVTMSGLEMGQNAGPERVIDLLESRISNAEKTMVNNIAGDCYSDGTANGGLQIGGLQLLVSTAPGSGTVGGISRLSWPFWRNIAYSATTNGGAAASSANIGQYMLNVWQQLVRNTEMPDLIVGDNNYWGFYHQSLVAIQRIVSTSEAQSGWPQLKFMTADVIMDGGFGGQAPTNSLYFLNSKYLFLRPQADRNFVTDDVDRVPINQDAIVKYVWWMGNMTASNCSLQGVLSN